MGQEQQTIPGRESQQTEQVPDGALVLAASFTAEPLLDTLSFWADLLPSGLTPLIAPYAQVFQTLLDPASVLRQPNVAAAALCVRWSDLIAPGQDAGRASGAAIAEDLSRALSAAPDGLPILLVLCPSAEPDELSDAASEAICDAVRAHRHVTLCNAQETFERYAVDTPLSPETDRLAHIPYTDEALTALATGAARWADAILRPGLKMIAADCDNTLWSGVVGEDGVDGVEIGPAHQRLQHRIADQAAAGRIVSLLSKNEEADVLAVLRTRPEMALREEHVLAHRIGWQPKPAGLTAIADSFDIASDTALFLDDNPVECAEMRAAVPGAATVRVPGQDRIAAFADHLWLLDTPALTDEDRKRVARYRDGAARNSLKAETASLAEFLEKLGLVVEVRTATPSDIERIAQLTQRTTQFNASLRPADPAELVSNLTDEHSALSVVDVRDRFGEYGLVGAMRAATSGGTLAVDQFMLSCRALGRGVEHRMLAALGEQAALSRCDAVRIEIATGPRNAPVRRFLTDALSASEREIAAGSVCRSARDLSAVRFSAAMTVPAAERENTVYANAFHEESAVAPRLRQDRGTHYERIAWELTSAQAIRAAMRRPLQPRPDLPTPFLAPRAGLERDIASIWAEVLGLDRVGAKDRFQDLGGKSLHLVRVHGLLRERLGIAPDLTLLFAHATPTSLANALAPPAGPVLPGSNGTPPQPSAAATTIALADRASQMRAARDRFATRAAQQTRRSPRRPE
ncbi:MAG: HAD-IIIC family phosphatase [Pseudomonadota bacterium]